MKLTDLLDQIAQEQDILDTEFEDPLKSNKGEGYLTNVAAVCIKGRNKSDGSEVALHLIIKMPPINRKLRESLTATVTFHRELYMYSTVFPAFDIFERDKGISDPFPVIARCYKTCKETTCEAIILENMKVQDYSIWEQNIVMDDVHVRLVLAQYARFHSVSLAIHNQKPGLFKKFAEVLDENLEPFLMKSGFFSAFINKARNASNSLDPIKDKEILKAYQKFLGGIEETFIDLMRCVKNPLVILHGDCWTNNMLIKYKDNDIGKPVSMRIVDYQFARVSDSPVFDLAWFIYICASKDIINNLNVYLRYYHDLLANHLRKLGSDPEKVFQFSQLEEHWKIYSKFGLIVSAFFRHILLTEKDETIDLTEIVESGQSLEFAFDNKLKHVDEYNSRMRNVITHFVTNNYI